MGLRIPPSMESRQHNWKRLLKKHAPLQLPAACDALTAKIIEDAGFPAYQIGGFALDGMRMGFPDMDVTRLGEKSAAVRDIIHASRLPVLVDADDGYGDAKNVTHTIHTYDDIGASAVFMEDQKSPKRCGHMAGKEVIPAKDMVAKIKAAVEARRDKDKLFLLARTDALEPEGLDEALRRGDKYLNAGADGIYVEGPRNRRELEQIGREFRGEWLAVTILEGGGKTPWVPPDELHALGFSMILYPTTILFRITRAMQRALADLKTGQPMPKHDSVTMFDFEKIVDIAYWKAVEQQALPMGERVHQAINRLFKRVA
jgi:2-methylisocitrate lyase-like PEP mutase family enzyme